MKNGQIIWRISLVLIVSMLFIFGCDEVDDPDYVSPDDSTSADSLVSVANASMDNLMQNMFDAEPDSAQEMLDILDFSEPYGLYVTAHELDYRNNDANFGMAFTGFIMLTQDEQLQEMLLRWESYFNVHEPFAVSQAQPTPGNPGYGLPLSVDGIRIPIAPFFEIPLALAKMSVDDVPQFSEFQDLVGTLFLPVIEESLVALDSVDNDPDFIFLISAAMQGETEADPIELDLTEIYALEMGLHALKGVLKTVVAYNFNFVSFDSTGIITELSQGSDFATLKTNGTADLNEALASANTAFEKAFNALDFLEAETDDQSNDLIQLDEDDDITEIRADIEEAQSALQGPTMIHYEYWEDINNDGEDDWVEDSIRVDISQFFNNPIEDFKAMLPPYTMSTSIVCGYDSIYISEHIHFEETSVSVPNLSGTYIEIDLEYHTYDVNPTLNVYVTLGPLGYNLATANRNDLPELVWDAYDAFLALIATYPIDSYHNPHVRFNWSGTVTTGEALVIDGDVIIEYEEMTASYVAPDPSWDSASYTEWLAAWPDPTMQGIFPDLDATGLAEFLGFNEENWNDFNY